MNKADLIEAVALRLDGSKKLASEAVESMMEEITKAVANGERVALTGFGVFEKVDRAARTGRNPLTGAVVKIKATSVPKFRPGTEFKLLVAGKRRAPAKKAAPAKKTAAKATPARTAAKKTAAVKATPAKKTAAVKATPAKKAPAKKAVAKR